MSEPNGTEARIAAGRGVYARNFGVRDEQAEDMLAERAGARYAREALLAAGGPGWNGSDLSDRDRAIAVIAALVSQHVTDERLLTYVRAARSAGVTDQGLEELMILLTAYMGQPAPSAAIAAIRASADGDR
jgi:4-carboxymuconolactone decarboxylase